MTGNDALKALEAARGELAEARKAAQADYQELNEVMDERDAANERLQRDAGRLDYMERVQPITFRPAWKGDCWSLYPDPNSEDGSQGKTFREAIDAAIAAIQQDTA